MKRREFVRAAGLGLAASAVAGQAVAQTVHCTASVADARGQAPDKATARFAAPKRVGFLLASSKRAWSDFLEEFRDALADAMPETPFKIRFSRGGNAKKTNYPREAEFLARLPLDIIVVAGSEPLKALLALGSANLRVPIVVASAGVIPSIPTGVTVSGYRNGQVGSASQRFSNFKTYVGRDLAKMAILYNKDADNAVAEAQAVATAAQAASITTENVEVADEASAADIMGLIQGRDTTVVKSLYVCTDPLLTMHRDPINTAALLKGLPTMYQFRQHVEAGGLMSYGADFTKLFREAASLVGKFLDLGQQLDPIQDATLGQFDLVWNKSTARILNLHPGNGYEPPNFKAQGGVVIE